MLTGKPSTSIHEFSYAEIIAHYKNTYKINVDEGSLRHRFGHICDESKNEGFFASKVIIIEGETEKYSLPIYFGQKGFDLDEKRIAIISAGSVDNISYLYVVFNEFNIPCYIIFDGDKPNEELDKLLDQKRENAIAKSRRNIELYELLNEPTNKQGEFFFPETTVADRFAVWEYDFEHTFHKTIDNYEQIKEDATRFYGTKSKPLTGRFIATEVTTKFPEKICTQIDALIDKINNCCWKGTCLKKGL